jgi:hypothetical protein
MKILNKKLTKFLLMYKEKNSEIFKKKLTQVEQRVLLVVDSVLWATREKDQKAHCLGLECSS